MNHELIASHRKSDAVNEELAKFNDRISHDLLGRIKSSEGLLNLMFDDLENRHYSDVKEYATRLNFENSRLQSLLSNLLKAQKSGYTQEKCERINLFDLIHSITDVNAIELKEKKRKEKKRKENRTEG